MQVPQPDLSTISLDLVADHNGLELKAMDNTAHVTSDFTFSYLFITASGKADIKVNKAGVDALVDVSNQAGTPSYDQAPKLTLGELDITINPDDVDIQLSGGSLVTKIANILIPLLKSTVIPQVVSQAKSTVSDLINTTVDQDLQQYGSQAVIPYLAGVTFDYGQMGDGLKISETVAQGNINGTFFDANKITKWAQGPASFNAHDPKGKQAQGYVTQYMLNTALYSGW